MARRIARFDIRQSGRQILLVLGIVAAVNLGFYIVWVHPTLDEYRALSEEQQPFKELNERRDLVENHEAFLEGVQRAEAELLRLREEVLSTRDRRLVDVEQELDALCQRFGIDYNAVNMSSEFLADEGLDRFTMNVPLEGNYRSLREFLQAVEESEKFLVVERVSLGVGKEGGKQLSLNIALATYFTLPDAIDARRRAIDARRRG